MKIIFMGTPEFAVPFLKEILNTEHIVTAVFTQPPKMHGRGLKIEKSCIHKYAEEHGIPVYTPNTLKTEEVLRSIQNIDADVIVVVAYGFILPQEILEAKKYGCINVHPSILPKYRGAAPMQHTIINGDKETGVCIIQMNKGMDTGDIILQENFSISEKITLEELITKCSSVGSELLIKALDNIKSLPRMKQSTENISIAHKINKEHGKINWNESAFQIDCKIRALNPWPGVFFEYQGEKIKVFKANYKDEQHEHNYLPGEVINNKLHIACGKGVLEILELQRPNKKAMTADEFLNGNKIPKGALLN